MSVVAASKPPLRKRSRPSVSSTSVPLPSVRTCNEVKEYLLPFDKILHLKKLFKFMPPVDSQFISTFFKQYNDLKIVAAALSLGKAKVLKLTKIWKLKYPRHLLRPFQKCEKWKRS